jgi:hypothetical protein
MKQGEKDVHHLVALRCDNNNAPSLFPAKGIVKESYATPKVTKTRAHRNSAW